jgi:hypothetical protein
MIKIMKNPQVRIWLWFVVSFVLIALALFLFGRDGELLAGMGLSLGGRGIEYSDNVLND